MSTKTFLKRAAMVAVASLGLGLLAQPSAPAAVITSSLTLSSATATANVGDSATGSWTARWSTDSSTTQGAVGGIGDSVTVKYGCDAPAGATCPAILARQLASADTAGIYVVGGRSMAALDANVNTASWVDISAATGLNGWSESTTQGYNISARSPVSFKAMIFPKAGTYTYTFSLYGPSNTAITGTSTTWTVTVSAISTKAASIKSSFFAPTNAQAEYYRYGPSGDRKVGSSSTDSGIVIAAGLATASTLAGVLYLVPANSNGDTRVAVGDGYAIVQDTLTATITGGGTISANSGSTKSASATLNVTAYGYDTSQYSGESLVVYTNGTVGTATISISTSAGVVLLTKTVTFTGAAASASTSLSDTYTYLGVGTVDLVAQVKDAGGNLLNAGTLYVMSTDTNIVSGGASLYSNAATQYQTGGRCGATSGWDTVKKKLTCSLTIGGGTNGLETGTATIYLADSWNATAATFTSTAITLTVSGNALKTVSVAFDKATYAPGEAAVVTITASDVAGRNFGSNGTSGHSLFTKVTSTPELTYSSNNYGTTNAAMTSAQALKFTPLNDGATETRVVIMPSYGTDVSYTLEFATFGSTSGAKSTASGTAKVVDPGQAAQDKAIADAQVAADAATDAALQAIDAANAATDAANLAAEAADAATVAAEEAKDAADAATAAVEALATQVATLMAALQAQVRSLANTVAKIAKKVKA